MKFEEYTEKKFEQISKSFIKAIEREFLTRENMVRASMEIIECAGIVIPDALQTCKKCGRKFPESCFLPTPQNPLNNFKVCAYCLDIRNFIKRIRRVVRGGLLRGGQTKKSRTTEVLGCSFNEFRCHIESQFKDGLGWHNTHLWHLDHIVPISSARNEDEVLKLNHYSNFQPLWAGDNIRKGAKK